jgi:type I restriction enzyme S subunit
MDLIGGGTPKTSKPEYWNGDIPWLSVKDFNNDCRYVYKTEKHITRIGLENSSTKLLQKGDVIISARGTVGEIATIPFPMAFNQSCYGLRAKPNMVTADFLYYLIMHNVHVLKKNTHGSVFDTITRDTFDSIEVDIPDIETQARIASILSVLDEKIELNIRINENLEQQMDSFYAELFIQNADPAWKSGTITDLGIVTGGSTPSKKVADYYTNHGIAWITPKDLSQDRSKFFSHGEIDITKLGLSKSSAVMMPAGTVLFSSRAPIGYIAIAANELCTNQGFKSVVPKAEIGTAFVYCFLKANLPIIESMASGSTFKEVSGSTMKSVPAVIPDQQTIKQFNEFSEPLLKQQQNLEAENRRLAEIRDSLLPHLMSGEQDVSDVNV